jgi:cellulose synthase/poly-beta-1,6-N-acetylglucosamine synthase-like glycosyltransferase
MYAGSVMTFTLFSHVFDIAAWLLVLATLPGTLYLLVLSIAGLYEPCTPHPVAGANEGDGDKRGHIAIIVPAHNESGGIAKTVANLCSIANHDGAASVVVIADNCDDDTAGIARSMGVRVLERDNALRRGKGYALDWAFCHLDHHGYLGYIIVDADTTAQSNLLSSVRKQFDAGADAVQARYTVLNAGQSARTRIAELALLAINCLRPRGRQALGLSAGIFGNGFALRRSLLEKTPYTATSVVEDLEYHIHLIEHGVRVHFADDTEVRGEMPVANAGQRTQRARWEGGRLRMLLNHGPTLACRVLKGQGRFIDPLLDLLLLPLGYHALLLLSLVLIPGFWPTALGLSGLAVLAGHVIAAAQIGGMSFARLGGIVLDVPKYLFWKLCMLPSILGASKTAMRWVRTDRESSR